MAGGAVDLPQGHAADAMDRDHLLGGENQGETAGVEPVFGPWRVGFRQALSRQIQLQRFGLAPIIGVANPPCLSKPFDLNCKRGEAGRRPIQG
jgi:hypothetical protein